MNHDDDNEIKKQIVALSKAWGEAIVSNDAQRIGSFMADNWLMISSTGVATKKHFLSYITSGQLTHSAMDLAEIASINVHGDTVIFAARVTNTAHFGGETFDANEWTSDVFVKIDGEWKCVMTHYTPVQDRPDTKGEV